MVFSHHLGSPPLRRSRFEVHCRLNDALVDRFVPWCLVLLARMDLVQRSSLFSSVVFLICSCYSLSL